MTEYFRARMDDMPLTAYEYDALRALQGKAPYYFKVRGSAKLTFPQILQCREIECLIAVEHIRERLREDRGGGASLTSLHWFLLERDAASILKRLALVGIQPVDMETKDSAGRKWRKWFFGDGGIYLQILWYGHENAWTVAQMELPAELRDGGLPPGQP